MRGGFGINIILGVKNQFEVADKNSILIPETSTNQNGSFSWIRLQIIT